MHPTSILILSASDVDTITKNIPTARLVSLMRGVFLDLSSDQISPDDVQTPHRTSITMPHHTTLFMPSRLASSGGSAIKIVSVPRPGAPAVLGLPATTIVMDESTGGIKGIVNARSLTALRTAAGCLLATTLLIPPPESSQQQPEGALTLVCFGAGLQILSHCRLLLGHYGTSIGRCAIVNRSSNERLRSTVQELSRAFPEVNTQGIASNVNLPVVEEVVRAADIICTATSSTEPLFPSTWVKPGAHINLVGSYTPDMREVDDDLIKRARLVLVDSKEACAREAGELISAGSVDVESGEITDGRVVEIGAFARSRAGGDGGSRMEDSDGRGDVTIFKSVGVGAQDVAIASFVVQLAEQSRVGTETPFD